MCTCSPQDTASARVRELSDLAGRQLVEIEQLQQERTDILTQIETHQLAVSDNSPRALRKRPKLSPQINMSVTLRFCMCAEVTDERTVAFQGTFTFIIVTLDNDPNTLCA